MKKIGFIGLGTMGAPMAKNLLKKGYEIIVYNRTKTKAQELAAQGAALANSPAEAAKLAEVVFTMLTADQAVDEVVLGANGVLEGASAGMILVDCSTISPKTSVRVAGELSKIGVEMLDAPVSGSEPQAIEGMLTFIVGGKRETYDRCLPLFEAMGKASFYMGENGTGSYTKLANNTMAAINLLSMAESIVMATKAGIDPAQFVQVVSSGGARSGMVDTKAAKVLQRDFRPHFATALMHKDLSLAIDIAKELEIPVPILAHVRQMMQMAMSRGYAYEDMCSVVKLYEEWANVEVKEI